MKIYTTIPIVLKPYFDAELLAFQKSMSFDDLEQAWNHLERAHIIGQRYPYAHSYVHWKMLLFGLRIKSSREVIGQIPRLIFGGVKSFVGKVPTGNPGGSNVSALKSYPIEDELIEILKKVE